MQLNSPFTDEGDDILAALRCCYDMCAGKRRRQLALSSNKVVCRRLPEGAPKYAVGMVVKTLTIDLRGVIVSWDLQCKESGEWIGQYGIRNLARGEDQPFYHILSYHDLFMAYVAEGNGDRNDLYCKFRFTHFHFEITEDLEIVDSSSVNNAIYSHEIGIHFERWDGVRFVPNAEKMARFPDDDEAAVQLLSK